MNWYYYRRIGLNIPAFWRHITHLLPALVLPAAVAVLIARFAPAHGYSGVVLWGCIYAAVYAASMWLFGMNRYERGLVSGMLRRITRR